MKQDIIPVARGIQRLDPEVRQREPIQIELWLSPPATFCDTQVLSLWELGGGLLP